MEDVNIMHPGTAGQAKEVIINQSMNNKSINQSNNQFINYLKENLTMERYNLRFSINI